MYSSNKAGQAFEAFQEMGPGREAFRVLAGIMVQDKNRAALEKLIALRRKEKPIDPEFGAYEARLKVLAGNIEEATALFDGAWKKTPELERLRLVSDFVGDLAQLGHGVDAYVCVPDKKVAFQQLAWRLRGSKNLADWERLIDRHSKNVADDPQLSLERAELHLAKNELAQAEKLFLSAKTKPGVPEFSPARFGLMRTRIRLGKAEETYREFGAGFATFRDLADQCFMEKNPGQMQALLDAHRKAFPNAKNLAVWEVEILWLKKDYPATAQRISANRGPLLGNLSHRWKCESYLVRSLVRSKNAKDALQEAQTMNGRKNGPQILLVLAIAASGDVQGAIAAIEKAKGQRYLVEDCFRDEDLGPILRSDAFRDFRKKYPEPPKSPADLAEKGS
jgi:hypothetical protein